MCKRTSFTDSTECFHMFLAEVGVGIVYSLHFPGKLYCGDVTKIWSRLLALHFCNADILDADTKHQQASLSSDQRSHRSLAG